MCYNLGFTSLPILLYGLIEQDYSAKKLMQYPYLYKLNKNNYLMSKKQLIVWMFLGLFIQRVFGIFRLIIIKMIYIK